MIVRKEFPEGFVVYDRPDLPSGLLLMQDLELSDVDNLKGKEMAILAEFIKRFEKYEIETSFKGKTTYKEMIDDYSSFAIFQDILKDFCEAFTPPAEKKI